jgi:hypothetical protein
VAKNADMQVHQCQQCGKEWSRPAHRGQQPKWCSVTCRELGKYGAHRVCKRCGRDYFGTGKSYCSRACAGSAPFVVNDDLLVGYRDSDWPRFLRGLRATTAIGGDRGTCWVWTGSSCKDGYPRHRVGGRQQLVHRLALGAQMGGADIGRTPVHHACGNRKCVNPDHLQLVTTAENNAEMLARTAFLSRIADLEAALAALDPHHPLLAVRIT